MFYLFYMNYIPTELTSKKKKKFFFIKEFKLIKVEDWNRTTHDS